jgi:hypothetical protein
MAKGDQIYVWRKFANLKGVYKHHGIDCGNGTVIHYRKPSEIIERTSLATFTRGNKIYVCQYPEGFCFIDDVVVHRAESRLGENNYNLLFNNCEHFATWCKTGISDSKQIREFIPVINKLDTYNLSEPIKKAIQGMDKNRAENILDKALGDIRIVWDQIQPRYKNAVNEVEIWDKVARRALQNNREDLAREALKRKLKYAKTAQDLQQQLEKLATMTENLLQNKYN